MNTTCGDNTETGNVAGFIGKGEAYRRIINEIQKIQKTDTTSILVQGETGTGKELIARSIHFGGSRCKGPFIPLNCATIPFGLAESSLFGHVPGAFTGASAARKGYFELADKGTLFLDEIGDMPPDLQVKILRVLEDRIIRKVGSHYERKVDVRVIAATNANLRQKMDAAQFREDLYYRLARFTIHAPPLRRRKEDIPLLVKRFANLFAAEMKGDLPRIGTEAMGMLLAYSFPGNVRELKNIIEHALIVCDGPVILPEHIRFLNAGGHCAHTMGGEDLYGGAKRSFGEHAPAIPRSSLPRDQMEIIMIKGALVHVEGNVTAAAGLLNVSADQVRQIACQMDENRFPPIEATDEERIKNYLLMGGSINNTQCRKLLNVNLHRASYLLKKMCREGDLIKERGGRWTCYRLAPAGSGC